MGNIRIADVYTESIVDGPGIRYTIFTQGCKHKCKGCHNPQTHSMDGGVNKDIDELIKEIKFNRQVDGVTISGGDPFEQPKSLAELVEKLKDNNLNIVAYTGYTYEDLVGMRNPDIDAVLEKIDILIDGPYVESKRDLQLRFRGSSNQRLIDMEKTRKYGRIIQCVEYTAHYVIEMSACMMSV